MLHLERVWALVAMFKLPAPDAYLSEQETADLLGFSIATLRIRRGNGEIRAIKMGRTTLHTGKHIGDYLASCETSTQQHLETDQVSRLINSTGSASDPVPPSGNAPGSIPERIRHAAQASAQQTFAPRTRRSQSGGLRTAA